jgi:APA family basic amino acid/polyamine antiporter
LDLGAIASLSTVALTFLLAQSRIFYAMAHDGLLPPIFAKIHSRTKVPWVSVTISGKYPFVVTYYLPFISIFLVPFVVYLLEFVLWIFLAK